jgi:ABC-type oligopeptide transport system ATPase subunit
VIRVRDVAKVFATRSGPVHAVRGVSFEVSAGETVGLVGESGSGKSTVAQLVLALERPTSGTVEVAGTDLAGLSTSDLKRLRRRMQMVFQNPYGSLLPHYTAAANVAEPLRLHGERSKPARHEAALAMLERVGIARRQAHLYPRQFSGGQQQRIAIARALVLRPELLVCDEPTSSLDVSVQAQILELLTELGAELTCLFISHDLAVIERMADRVVVMCRGRVVESAPTAELFAAPAHPYTQELLAATRITAPAPEPSTWDTEGVLTEIAPNHHVLTHP